MKAITLAGLIALLTFSCRNDDSEAKKEELKNVILDYYTALSNLDLKKANNLTADNLTFYDNGRPYTNQSAIDSVKLMGQFKAVFSIESLNVHVDKRDASAYYFLKSDFDFADGRKITVRFFETATFNKRDDKWRIRVLHSSVLK